LDTLVAGDSQVQVEGYRTVRIQVTRPSGTVTVKLGQVAFIPQFQTNTVSLCHGSDFGHLALWPKADCPEFTVRRETSVQS
jgi:hypothetical protein